MELSAYIPVWEKLNTAQQTTLIRYTVSRKIKKGTIIHSGDTECTGLLLVQSGQLRAYILSPEGREITIYRLFERDLCLLSASCILHSLQFNVTIEAEKDTVFYLIPAEIYKEIMKNSASLSNFTNEIMATRFSEVMWLMEQVLWKSFDRRLAGFLLEESAINGTDCLKITHETIGRHMGNPREVVTRMLRYFQNEGMVNLRRGTVEITDAEKLKKLAES